MQLHSRRLPRHFTYSLGDTPNCFLKLVEKWDRVLKPVLVGYRWFDTRVALKAGETKNVTLEFPVSELAHWDNETNGWVLEPGKIEILVGSASNDIRQSIHTEI